MYLLIPSDVSDGLTNIQLSLLQPAQPLQSTPQQACGSRSRLHFQRCQVCPIAASQRASLRIYRGPIGRQTAPYGLLAWLVQWRCTAPTGFLAVRGATLGVGAASHRVGFGKFQEGRACSNAAEECGRAKGGEEDHGQGRRRLKTHAIAVNSRTLDREEAGGATPGFSA